MRHSLENTGKRIRTAKRIACFFFVILILPVVPAMAADTAPAGEADRSEAIASQTGLYGKNPGVFHYPAIHKVGFIRMPQVTPMGSIAGSLSEKKQISQDDTLYIQPADGALDLFVPGSRYTVFRCMSPTDGKNAAKTIGTQHFIVGIAEILQTHNEMATARVVKSFRPIVAGDLLMPEIQDRETFPLKPGNPDIEGTLIGPEEHFTLMGDDTIVFIDKGRADHIEIGQEYVLFREAMLAQKIVSPPIQVGKIVVLRTAETTSTAVITKAFVDIQRGERFRAVIGESK